MNDIPRTDQQVRIELAREARDLMENRAFAAAIGVLRTQWVNEIENDATDAPKVQELAIRLRTLAAIPALLKSLMASPMQRGDYVRRSG